MEITIDLSEYTYVIVEAMNRYPDDPIIKVGMKYIIEKKGDLQNVESIPNQ